MAESEYDARIRRAKRDGYFFDHIVVNRITVACEEGKEAMTLIAQTPSTYPMIRWLNAKKDFLFGLVAHEKKKTSKGVKIDNHFSMYTKMANGKRDGVVDIEFNEEEPMLSIQRLGVRMVDGAFLTVLGDDGKRYKLKVNEKGELYPERINMRADSVYEEKDG